MAREYIEAAEKSGRRFTSVIVAWPQEENATGKLLDESVLAGVRKRCTLLRFASQDETEANVTEALPEIATAMYGSP